MGVNDESILIEMNCSCHGNVLPIIRNFIRSVAREMGFCEEETAKIEISVDEASSNILCHAYKDELKQESSERSFKIRILVRTSQDHLQVSISDYGIGNKDGEHMGVQNIEEFMKEGYGLGTYIIHKFMDKVEVLYPRDAGTTVSMVKFLQTQKQNSYDI